LVVSERIGDYALIEIADSEIGVRQDRISSCHRMRSNSHLLRGVVLKQPMPWVHYPNRHLLVVLDHLYPCHACEVSEVRK
jgi:hypothetical protein